MAQPIVFQAPRRDLREELRSRVEQAPAEHAEAVLAAYEVLQGLHDSGVLEFVRGLLGSRDKVLGNVVDATDTPEMIHIIRNLLNLARTMAAIDPELFEGFVLALPQAIARARAEAMNPPGFWQILNKFRSKDLRRGLVAVNSLLEE
jgi:uncharacterized protein YjgD (DUF1641 family)